MAAIAVPPESSYSTGFVNIKDQPTVEIAEAKPESDDQEADSGIDEGENSTTRRWPWKPKPPPVPKPEPALPVAPGVPHPVYGPNSKTLDNVATHMMCNSWFLMNVRELVEQYKSMAADNANQARQIACLERDNCDLNDQVSDITAERDDAILDYESERIDHSKTRDDLRCARIELADLGKRYEHNLTELKHTKAHLGEARRENRRLNVQIDDKNSRINDLEEKLRISNAFEDKANDRVTELQHIIYDLERRNASLEKTKDRAEQVARAAEDSVQDLQRKNSDLHRIIRRLTRDREVHISEAETADEAVQAEYTPDPEDPIFEGQSQPTVEPEQNESPAAEE